MSELIEQAIEKLKDYECEGQMDFLELIKQENDSECKEERQ